MAGFDDRNVIGIFRNLYDLRFEGSWARRLALFNGASDRETENYGIFGGFPKMREWLGARQENATNQKPFSISNKIYESSLGIPIPMLDRDKTGLLDAYINKYTGVVVANHWEDLLISLINNAGTSGYNSYDAVTFFSSSHQFASETAQKNTVTSSEVPALDVTTSTAPTAIEMAAVILGLVGYMMTFKDDQGRYVNGNARKFVIAVSTAPLFAAALQAITANLLTGPVDNPIKGLMLANFQFDVKMIPDLTSATSKVRIFREDDGTFPPFILQEEKPITTNLLGRGSEHAVKTNRILLALDGRRGAGYGEWMSAIEGTLS